MITLRQQHEIDQNTARLREACRTQKPEAWVIMLAAMAVTNNPSPEDVQTVISNLRTVCLAAACAIATAFLNLQNEDEENVSL